MRIASVLALSLAVVALAGCSNTHKITTSEGTTTVQTQNGGKTATFSNSKGTFTVGANAVDASKLGLPIYPGATAKDNGGMTATSGQETSQTVVLTTPDSFDKVYAWYKGQMPADSEKMHMTASGSGLASFVEGKAGDKVQKSVMITADKDKTSIMLSNQTKNQ